MFKTLVTHKCHSYKAYKDKHEQSSCACSWLCKSRKKKIGKCVAPTEVTVKGKKPLIIFSSAMLGNFFTKEALLTQCRIGKKNGIIFTSLLDTDSTGIAFINKKIICHICKLLQISFVKLNKPKLLKKFDSQSAPPITHAIYFILTIQNHTKEFAPLLVTKLGQHPVILSKP